LHSSNSSAFLHSFTSEPFRVEDKIGGYKIERLKKINTPPARFFQLRHIASGASHVHIDCEDSENVFSVAFKTPPEDNRGVPHALEHSILCGSKKYPTPDPLYAIMKRGLSTYIHPLTSADWTLFPFATLNSQDFRNLMSVYLDFAFFPLLPRIGFKKQVHRLEIGEPDPSGRLTHLTRNGILYNEMKGVISSPDKVCSNSLLKTIYPDSIYRFDSGGDPALIPDITYEDVQAYHQRYYRPRNSFFYTYGNLPLEPHLKAIESNVLNQIDPGSSAVYNANQPRWRTPRKIIEHFACDPQTTKREQCHVNVAWLTVRNTDTLGLLTLKLVERVLIGNPSSPLHEALVSSGLGTALTTISGVDATRKDVLFICGLKGVAKENTHKVAPLLLETLGTLVFNGIDGNLVQSAINRMEFLHKEVTHRPYPFGIKLLYRFINAWIQGGAPDNVFRNDKDFHRLRKYLMENDYLENFIRHHLFENPHQLQLTMIPNPTLWNTQLQKETSALKKHMAGMTRTSIQHLKEDTSALLKLKEQASDTSCLPTLTRRDSSDTQHSSIPTTISSTGQVTTYEQDTAGIFYLTAVFGVGQLKPVEISLMPFFCFSLPRLGGELKQAAKRAAQLEMYTGGIQFSVHARPDYSVQTSGYGYVALNAKCLNTNLIDMLTLVSNIIAETEFYDFDHLRTLLHSYQEKMRYQISRQAHRFALSLSCRKFSPISAINEAWYGIHHFQNIHEWAYSTDKNSISILAHRLEDIAYKLFTHTNMQIAFIGDKSALKIGIRGLSKITDRIQKGGRQSFSLPPAPSFRQSNIEGWSTESTVSSVVTTIPSINLLHPDSAAIAVISKLIWAYVHHEIREKRGAYAGLSTYNSELGYLALSSVRDPDIANTLKVYSNLRNYMLSKNFTYQDIESAILLTIAKLERPESPGRACRKAFIRNLISLSDEIRMSFKSDMLTLRRPQIKEVIEKYFHDPPDGCRTVILASSDNLSQVRNQIPEFVIKEFPV